MHHLLEEEDKIELHLPPREPSTALVFSLLLPGMGQVYNGQLCKGLLFASLRLIYPLVFAWLRTATWFYGLVLLLLTEMVIRLYASYDAVVVSNRQQYFVPKAYNTWYYQLLIAFIMIGSGWCYQTSTVLGVQSFSIPTASGEPTLQRGDKLIADTKAYEVAAPKAGDIVVYKKDGLNMVLRVAGLPGDTVSSVDNTVIINGHKAATHFIKNVIVDNLAYTESEEIFANGHRHHILQPVRHDHTLTTSKSIIVPQGHYYLLGDNRANATDSRLRGLVTREQIIGRVVYSYWGSSPDRINQDFRAQ